MTYVVTQSCSDSQLTNCVDVCPVDAFREGPEMLYIDPDVCIDCNACLSECPVRAIYPEQAVPEAMLDDIQLNAIESKRYPVIRESREPEPGVRVSDPVVASSVEAAPGTGQSSGKRRFAVVGAGPSGFYATEEILNRSRMPKSTFSIDCPRHSGWCATGWPRITRRSNPSPITSTALHDLLGFVFSVMSR
ncbi:4Fe-4S dicluster domain-containing protein [Allohahella marinimesophila]|uniref:Ferredoxin n=1 Tax=Allohahella marinimesophila TaxID=1054972 RepID=A0ABP7NZ27_9GAMM